MNLQSKRLQPQIKPLHVLNTPAFKRGPFHERSICASLRRLVSCKAGWKLGCKCDAFQQGSYLYQQIDATVFGLARPME